MLKTIGTLASLSAAHLAWADQVLAEEVQATPSLARANVKAKRHHPRFRPQIEDDRHMQHSRMRNHKGRALQDNEVCSRAVNRIKDEQADFN